MSDPVDWSRYASRPRPFYGLPVRDWAVYRVSQQACLGLFKAGLRLRTTGLERMPKDGPVLLLANHVSMLDPFYVAAALHRPSRFMGASTVLDMPVLGAYLKAVGGFPKIKDVKDRDSMATLQKHYDAGLVVTVFPEGRRSWDGRLTPITPGIGRLIDRLGARVFYARLKSTYLVHPRWAKYPRYVPLEIDYDGPYTYEGETVEAITADVIRKLTVEQRRDRSRPARGYRMAEGLESLLWRCARCGSHDTMQVHATDRDSVACGRCDARWKLDVDTVLHGMSPDLPTFDVPTGFADQWRALGDPPVLDAAAWQADGTIGVSADMEVLLVARGGKQASVGRGELRVHGDGLELIGPRRERIWTCPFDKLLAVSNDVANQVFIRRDNGRRGGELFRLLPHGESPLKWGLLLQRWRWMQLGLVGG